MCPNLTKVVELILTLPVSNAWPERGASEVKIIKTDLRNRLKNDMLNGLLHVAVNGPDLCSEECDLLVTNSVTKWLKRQEKDETSNQCQVKRYLVMFYILLVTVLLLHDVN